MSKQESIQLLVEGKAPEERKKLLAQVEAGEAELPLVPAFAESEVAAAVRRSLASADADLMRSALSYVKYFMAVSGDILSTALAVDKTPAKGKELRGKTHMVSQAIVGDVNLVTGIYAEDSVFLELASRYAGEAFGSIDEMAIDSLEEFLNVVHGGYAVELAKGGRESDIDIPRWAANTAPSAQQQVQVTIDTAFGPFRVVVAEEEFIPALR